MTNQLLHHTVFAGALAICFTIAGASSQAQDAQMTPPSDFTAIVEELSPAVVGITARGMAPPDRAVPEGGPFGNPGPFGQQPGQQAPERERVAGGSGFMISEDGYFVTNNHVVEGASELEIRLADGTMREAELIGTDPATDIAVLRVADTDDIAVAPWGDSDAMEPGTWTIAIGSPFGLGGTVTVGVLSAKSRVIGAGPYDAFLQTDASINSGNSGGPLFNTDGEVIGVNTAIFSPGGGNVGIGFAVPSSIAQGVVQQLIETGVVERGFIGVSLQGINEALARALELDGTEGAIVSGVEPGAPAAVAGIREGDVILSLNGQPVEDPREISRRVADIAPGSEVPITIFRDGERIEVTLTLSERTRASENDEAMPPEGEMMGVSVSPVPELVRRNLGLEEGQALFVQGVQPGSPAAKAGIMKGDVIRSASGQDVATVEALSSAWAKARQAERPLLLRINRNGKGVFIAVEAAPEDAAQSE
ncbi:trypsin-like peptidase domain-containing protein [Roseovarius sp. D0-M9]|uniref:trypsin-like peptidase domain-containing protein n=1 Tax=Roseovarius sp. D0-M9 TaxID=3127117 RepID=UPI00300F931E